ncbi:MAG: WD40 repeat domain-containing protein [Acidimicrobiales bacterium]
MWEADRGAELGALWGHAGGVKSLAWSPNGTRLASASRGGWVRVWDADSGEEETRFVVGDDASAVEYSRRDGALAVGSDRALIVYKAR